MLYYKYLEKKVKITFYKKKLIFLFKSKYYLIYNMPEYTCELCKKKFSQKNDLTRHQKKKTSCITFDEMQQIIQTKHVKEDNKIKFINELKTCLNILRDNEGLTGDKALRNFTYLITLKLIEPHFEGEINIDDYEYDFSHIEDESVEKHKNKLLEIVRFSNLSNEKEDNISANMKHLWDDILSNHPATKNIFLKGKEFDIQRKSTYKKIIDKLSSLDLSHPDYDVLGNSYEEVIQDIMTGKVLGQYFTPPLIKKMMVKLINPQLHPDGKIDTCGDPAMGTGGFLITYLQNILQQATSKNIDLDWDFIKTEGLYGKELEPDTYQLAVSNMLISSGRIFENLERGDSIRDPITRKFDNILANPPFGINTLNYNDFQSPLKNEYLPIKTDNAVCLFIQAIIYMLKINGKCAVVLPDGQELFSKTNKTFIVLRKYLMKTCDLKEVIYLPAGIFTFTTIRTCVIFFVKKKEGTDILETKIKLSNTQEETSRDYNFSETHQTTEVKFYDFNPHTDVKNLLVNVPIENIASNSYSLSYSEYRSDETEEKQYQEDIIVKTLGDLCNFLPKSNRNAKFGNKEGKFPYYKSSQKVDSYVDEPDYQEESLIIGDGGEPNINYGVKFSASDHCYILQNKNKSLILKYAYYYLHHNLDIMKPLYTGVAIKNISKTNIKGIKIPILSLKCQQEIVKQLDFIYETIKASNNKIAELKHLKNLYLNHQKKNGVNVVKNLGDVFKKVKTGKDVPASKRKKGEYPFYGANGIIDHVDDFIFENTSLLTARTGSLGSLHISNGKFWCSGDVHVMEFDNDTLLLYTYYYLQTIDFQKFRTGTAHPKLSGSNLKSITIHIPSLERQKQIVEYCENNDVLIKQLEKDIENNKNMAQQFITDIVKTQVHTKDHDNISSVNTEPIVKVQNEIVSVEEKVIIEPKSNTKIINKKKPLVIVEQE